MSIRDDMMDELHDEFPPAMSGGDAKLMPRALSDVGNGERIVDQHGGDLRYCHALNTWLVWRGNRWGIDDTAEIQRRAKQVLTASLLEEALSEPDDKRRGDLFKHAARSQSASKIRDALFMASSDIRVIARPAELDANPFLLNVENGTLDLTTGELRPHNRADLITRLAPVRFDPTATCPLWNKCLETWLPNPEARGYSKRLFGYSLTGDSSEHIASFFIGSGANGKSVMLRTIMDMEGDYALVAAADLLILHRRSAGSASPEVAELVGHRLVAVLETDAGAPLHESRVKVLVGGDKTKGRALYAGYVEINPTWTLVLVTNHLPKISGQDEAIWRRIAIVPFEVIIPEAERDPQLVKRLAAERSGILNWALEGCLEWQRDGLRLPDVVRVATAAYRAESDPIAEWLADCCEINPHARSTSVALWESYCAHAGGKPALNRTAFGRRLSEIPLEESRDYVDGKTIRIRVGISLVEGSS